MRIPQPPPPPVYDTFGSRLRLARNAKNMTAQACARQVGVGSLAWSKWENARTFPSSAKLPAIATLLDVPMAWLMTGETEASAS
jgi:HTH-type transcriptional regulator, cell division transcriptional repressor